MKNYLLSIAALITLSTQSYTQECVLSQSDTLQSSNFFVPFTNAKHFLQDDGYRSGSDGPTLINKMYPTVGFFDPAGNLRLFGGNFEATEDPLPGPAALTGAPDPVVCAYFDRIWTVTRTDLIEHLDDLSDGSLDNPNPAIMNWPGRGNPLLPPLPNQPYLAPFFDANDNDLYDPANGDYPDTRDMQWKYQYGNTRPEKLSWWMISGHEDWPINIGCTAYYFENAAFEGLNYTTFYKFDLTNVADQPINSTYFNLTIDPQLGCGQDDYFGVNLASYSPQVYLYNADATDGDENCNCETNSDSFCQTPPVVGVQVVPSSVFMNDWYASDLDKVICSYAPSGNDVPPKMSHPYTRWELYNYISGKWRDNYPLSEGGTGYESSEWVDFMFTGTPGNPNEWTANEENLLSTDYRIYLNVNHGLIPAGERRNIVFAVTEFPEMVFPDLPRIDSVMNNIYEWYSREELLTNTSAPDEDKHTTVYPNPTNGSFRIELHGATLHAYRLYDLRGYEVTRGSTTLVETHLLPDGLYLLETWDSTGHRRIVRVIIQK